MDAVLEAGMAFYNYGDTVPQPQYQQCPWLRTQDMRWYYFEGEWKSPVADYSIYERRIWVGNPTQLETYDGGEAGAVSTTSGPMWEVDHTLFDGRSPMGVGDIPSSDPAKTLALIEQYGAGSHTQTSAEMPPHTHTLGFDTNDTGSGFPQASNGENEVNVYTTSETGGTGTPAVATPMNMVHPVVGVYFIKRTVREFYTAS